METFTAIATVRKNSNGYVLERVEREFPASMTIAEAEWVFKCWAENLKRKHATWFADLEYRIQVWGKDQYWSY